MKEHYGNIMLMLFIAALEYVHLFSAIIDGFTFYNILSIAALGIMGCIMTYKEMYLPVEKRKKFAKKVKAE